MPRYYFDLVDDETVYDKKGVTLPNMKAAEEYAATFAREFMETKPTLMGEGVEIVVGPDLQRQVRTDTQDLVFRDQGLGQQPQR
jgi:hypothetical protein